MSLSAGARLGPYEILTQIGAGGMGEVYRARDTRLERIVAIKVSSAQFGERFEREARAVAALNHPNICTLHDIGPTYLVMEYIEREPRRGPLRADARSDIFSFGIVLYEALCGQRPFRGDSLLATLAAILSQEPRPLRQVAPDVPEPLERIVARCLNKDPARRFQTATDLRLALE